MSGSTSGARDIHTWRTVAPGGVPTPHLWPCRLTWWHSPCIVGAIAIAVHSFTLLLAGTFLSGIYNAFGQYYRFAAADAAPPDWKSRAISLTLAGGIFGGFIGPAVGRFTRDLVEPRFLASYAALAVFALASFVIAAGLSFPEQSSEERHGTGRPLGAILRQPAVVVAVLAAAVGYGVMNLLMSVTPLAMDLCCGHPFSAATFVLALRGSTLMASQSPKRRYETCTLQSRGLPAIRVFARRAGQTWARHRCSAPKKAAAPAMSPARTGRSTRCAARPSEMSWILTRARARASPVTRSHPRSEKAASASGALAARSAIVTGTSGTASPARSLLLRRSHMRGGQRKTTAATAGAMAATARVHW